MTKLLIATRNKGKLREIKSILGNIPYKILSLDDVKISDEVEETGSSYEENAILKVRNIGEKAKLPTLAEDSGLEVDALGGQPGIYSARFARGTDEDKIDKILELMRDVPQGKRTARYITVIALYDPNTKGIQTFEGVTKGFITSKREGKGGFGYDPIFWSYELGKTFGNASDTEKNRVSHRSKALEKVHKLLLTPSHQSSEC